MQMQQQQFLQQQQFQQQQLDMQNRMLEQQKRLNQQISNTRYVEPQHLQKDQFSGNLKYDYYQYMVKVANSEAPYMSEEEFARIYHYRY